MNRTFIYLALWVGLAARAAEAAWLPRAENFLQARLSPAQAGDVKAANQQRILARPDPGTFFLRYAFGLTRHAKKLLTDDQAKALEQVLAQHTAGHSRWHDERNTVRCKFTEIMWRYAGASEAEAAPLRRELDEAMRLRMRWTEQEHLAQYRFARAVWEVLTPEQQGKLIAGEWKTYAAQETGHTRADATAKVITRALGKPDNKAAFEQAVATWSQAREPLHAAVSLTENNERRIVFAMDLNSEVMAHEASLKANEAFAKLYLAEAEATRRIVQAGYVNPQARCAKAAAEGWKEATERYAEGAGELIKVMGEK